MTKAQTTKHGGKNILRFEHYGQPLVSHSAFLQRLANSVVISLLIAVLWLALGTVGYHWLDSLAWEDAFLDASMIASGMGPVSAITGSAAKIFAALYAIFSGMVFLVIFSFLAAPVIHRIMHRFHMETKES